METAHRTATGLDADLHDLLDVVAGAGPFLSAVLETDAGVEQASDRSTARWGAQAQTAEADGVPRAVLDAVDPIVADAHLRGPRLFVLADEAGLRWREPLAAADPMLRWSPSPSLLPVIADRQRRTPVLIVRCDRRGAELVVSRPLSTRELEGVDPVDGPDHKVQGGGWSHRRYHQRVENQMAGTAQEIAEATTASADRLGVQGVVVLVGDGRITDDVAAHLPDRLDVRHVAGGRGPDGSDEAVADAVEELRGTVDDERTIAALQELEEAVQRGYGAEGDEAVLLALAEGRVQRLLVGEPPGGEAPEEEATDSEQTSRFDPTSGLPVLDDGATRDASPREGRTIDVAVRAAMATSASIRVVPGGTAPPDGLGAVLRWDEGSDATG